MKQIAVTENSEIDEIVEFSRASLWKPHYQPSQVRRFLTEFISDKNLIFDFHDGAGRVVSAVLLDKVNNPANDACLEILGLRTNVDAEVVLHKLLGVAQTVVPRHRSGFQVTFPDNTELADGLANHFGLNWYYDTCEMTAQLGETLKSPDEIIDATQKNRDETYDVLCKAFAQNPDTSIPEPAIWREYFLKNPASRIYLWQTKDQILGFANLVDDGHSAEIRTIGVLPQARGLGIGNKLLHHCLSQAKKVGKESCHLTVAVQNDKALGLYLRAGFKTVEKFKCYRKSIP